MDNFIKKNKAQSTYQCTQYANNPYLCANEPASKVVVPQGEVKLPESVPCTPVVQTILQPPPNTEHVNYNQITPYINSNSAMFKPEVQTKSGYIISSAPPVSSKPVTQNESQVVYEGPVKIINPQITPVEQTDSEINRKFIDYYKKKAEFNDELKKTLKKTFGYEEKEPFYKKALKVLGVALLAFLVYKFRTKIPFIKKFFKKSGP